MRSESFDRHKMIASQTIEKAQVRTRAIGRKLRDVQLLPVSESQSLLMIEGNRAGPELNGSAQPVDTPAVQP